jgi:hypothetical protein
MGFAANEQQNSNQSGQLQKANGRGYEDCLRRAKDAMDENPH